MMSFGTLVKWFGVFATLMSLSLASSQAQDSAGTWRVTMPNLVGFWYWPNDHLFLVIRPDTTYAKVTVWYDTTTHRRWVANSDNLPPFRSSSRDTIIDYFLLNYIHGDTISFVKNGACITGTGGSQCEACWTPETGAGLTGQAEQFFKGEPEECTQGEPGYRIEPFVYVDPNDHDQHRAMRLVALSPGHTGREGEYFYYRSIADVPFNSLSQNSQQFDIAPPAIDRSRLNIKH